MKILTTLLALLVLNTAVGQKNDCKIWLDSAKAMFKSERGLVQEELDRFDYGKIVPLLQKAIALNPGNAEARYFLGYTYSRMNAPDARSMTAMNPELVLKASEQFEKVNQLSPEYTGELITLDPYSKLTGEWGSMAMCYQYRGKSDSATWAFREGKRRGGFGEFALALNRKVLDACSRNAILLSYGDNFTMPLWYLQSVENYRKDVTVVDANLLNTVWYPSYLAQSGHIRFDLPAPVLDTIEYLPWRDSTVTIGRFSWTVGPSYYGKYLLRGDRVLLSLLRQNKFERDIYFTSGFNEAYQLGLANYLARHPAADKLTTGKKTELTAQEYSSAVAGMLMLTKYLNPNSREERITLDNFRYGVLAAIRNLHASGQAKRARELLTLLDQYAGEGRYPYRDEEGKAYADHIRRQL